MNNEIWKDIIGFEGKYQCSNTGKVRSLLYVNQNGIFKRQAPKVMKQNIDTSGYHQVSLCKNGIRTTKIISKIVLESFVGPIPSPIHHAEHLDGNTHNNFLSNLGWATPQQNSDRKKEHQKLRKQGCV
jgi:hypothetical protein